MSIRTRLALAFLAILGLFGINQAINGWSTGMRSDAVERLDRARVRQVLVANLRREIDNLHKQVTLLSEIHFDPGGEGQNREARWLFEQKVDSVTALVTRLRSFSESASTVDSLRRSYDQLIPLWRNFYNNLGVEQGWALAFLARADPISQRVLNVQVPEIEALENDRAVEAQEGFRRVTRLTGYMSLGIFVVSTLVALIVALGLARYLVGHLATLRNGAGRIGGLDLDHRIRLDTRDELGDLAVAFNDMADHLQVARGELTRANRELAQVNQLLESRIEEQLARLRLAARIQNDLLPHQAPDVAGYDFAGASIPAQEVGGDYFDYIPIEDGKLAVCLGDVSGKGLPASLLMANLQATVRGQALVHSTAAECLERSNTLLFRSTDARTFVTLFFGIIDARRHRLCYSNGGHNPPMIFVPGREPLRLETGGLLVGIREHGAYQQEEVPLEPGQVLVMYSDGITEALDPDNEEFGEQRLAEVVEANPRVSSAALIERIIDAVVVHARGCPQTDDMTLLVVQRV